MLIRTLPIPSSLTLAAEPLTPSSFAPFGAVLANPAPGSLPHNTPASALAPGAVSANQGTAIQYRKLAPPLRNLYAQSPTTTTSSSTSSSHPAEPRTTLFVCGARQLQPGPGPNGRSRDDEDAFFEVNILERHPFTTQTFVPLGASASSARYLVIVAPSLPVSPDDDALPAPARSASDTFPGPGMPDLQRVRAFMATGGQAVTYGAGTWHAPMAALGSPGSAIDFVVVQFANDVPIEDCQEVALEGAQAGGDGERKDDNDDDDGAPRIMVRVPQTLRLSKL
ncbi:hypothetical protein AAE478_006883 [Parahypoxylon ruwenzoriense]